MSLFTSARVTGSYDVPVTGGTPANPTTAVNLTTSEGVVSVFDSLETALRLMAQMRRHSQWYCHASEDVLIVSVSHVKLLVVEATFVNQKLFNSFVPMYVGDRVRLTHRNLSCNKSLEDALREMGVCLETAFNTNDELRLAETGIQVVDWNYPNSVLHDGTPLTYDFTA